MNPTPEEAAILRNYEELRLWVQSQIAKGEPAGAVIAAMMRWINTYGDTEV